MYRSYIYLHDKAICGVDYCINDRICSRHRAFEWGVWPENLPQDLLILCVKIDHKTGAHKP
jgi:hypothetical protein